MHDLIYAKRLLENETMFYYTKTIECHIKYFLAAIVDYLDTSFLCTVKQYINCLPSVYLSVYAHVPQQVMLSARAIFSEL